MPVGNFHGRVFFLLAFQQVAIYLLAWKFAFPAYLKYNSKSLKFLNYSLKKSVLV